jgi:hypothetical protein
MQMIRRRIIPPAGILGYRSAECKMAMRRTAPVEIGPGARLVQGHDPPASAKSSRKAHQGNACKIAKLHRGRKEQSRRQGGKKRQASRPGESDRAAPSQKARWEKHKDP